MGLAAEQDVVVDIFVKEVEDFLDAHPGFEEYDFFFSGWPCPDIDVADEICRRCLEHYRVCVCIVNVIFIKQMRSLVTVSKIVL
jgi:hypothetical protein